MVRELEKKETGNTCAVFHTMQVRTKTLQLFWTFERSPRFSGSEERRLFLFCNSQMFSVSRVGEGLINLTIIRVISAAVQITRSQFLIVSDTLRSVRSVNRTIYNSCFNDSFYSFQEVCWKQSNSLTDSKFRKNICDHWASRKMMEQSFSDIQQIIFFEYFEISDSCSL